VLKLLNNPQYFHSMRISIVVSVVLLSTSISGAQAQSGAGFPVQFIQFFKTYNLINPASIGKDSAVEFKTGNKSLTGAFSGVRTFYFNGNVVLNPSSKGKSRHALGASFINDKEGDYINRNRAALLYAVHLPLTRKITMSAGFAVGFLNFAYKASNISAGGSAFAPNADVGLWLHGLNFNIGISGNQIFPTTLSPIDEIYTIERHYNLAADRTFVLSPYVSMTPALVLRWVDQDNYNADVALILLVQRNVMVAGGYKYDKGVSLSGGLEKIKIGRQLLKMTFSYYAPLAGLTYYNPQSYELSFQFIPARGRKSKNQPDDQTEEEE
jgi:type IX secretion system PorP/SprF family membrane protein